MQTMTEEQHRQRHVELHQALDELIADWIRHTGKSFSRSTIYELMEWSSQQMENPTPTPHD